VSELKVLERFSHALCKFIFLIQIVSQVAAVLAFVRGAEAVGGFQRPKGGYVAGEAY
jgi:hypothetical protein